MSQGLVERESTRRLVNQHLPDKVKHVLPRLIAAHLLRNILAQRLAVLPHIPAVGAVLVPDEVTVAGKVLDP